MLICNTKENCLVCERIPEPEGLKKETLDMGPIKNTIKWWYLGG